MPIRFGLEFLAFAVAAAIVVLMVLQLAPLFAQMLR
jgi:hypothetical protein